MPLGGRTSAPHPNADRRCAYACRALSCSLWTDQRAHFLTRRLLKSSTDGKAQPSLRIRYGTDEHRLSAFLGHFLRGNLWINDRFKPVLNLDRHNHGNGSREIQFATAAATRNALPMFRAANIDAPLSRRTLVNKVSKWRSRVRRNTMRGFIVLSV